jgi:NTP pyrophosphatase (non-canonical NTP hydrolase)
LQHDGAGVRLRFNRYDRSFDMGGTMIELLETRDAISDWADKTFGPAIRIDRVVARANEEMAELLRAVTSPENDEVFWKIPEECADIAIVLMRAARHMDEDIDAILRITPFGGGGNSIVASAAKANDFMARLVLVSFGNGSSPPLAINLCGLICLHLSDICAAFDTDLNTEIHKKMNINRGREWKLDNTGHGYHITKGQVTWIQPGINDDPIALERGVKVVELKEAQRCKVCDATYPTCSGSRTGQCNNPPSD